MTKGWTLPHDWYPGEVPGNVVVDPSAYLGTSASFTHFRSRLPNALRMGPGSSLCDGTTLDVGPRGRVILGAYAVLSEGVRVISDAEVEVQDYALVAWEAVLMDSYGVSVDVGERRRVLERCAAEGRRPTRFEGARPVRIGRNAWVGFGACVLPGVTVGEGSVVAARSVVAEDVPPYTVVAGNPTRIVRRLDPAAREGPPPS